MTQQELDSIADKVADRILERMGSKLIEKEVMNTKEASKYLGISESRIRHLCCSGLIPYHSNATRSRNYFKRTELDNWRTHVKGYQRI